MASSECYRIGCVLLNAGTQEVICEHGPVPMPPLSLNLLLVLARNAPNVVTTRQLEEEVWSGLVVDRGTINKRVLLVRKALRDAGCEEEYISVVRGVGYRLAIPVEVIGDPDPVSRGQDSPPEIPVTDRPERKRFSLVTILAAVLALMSMVLVFLHVTEPQHTDAVTGQAPPLAAAAAVDYTGTPTVAVLTFMDRNKEDPDSYLAGGVSSQLSDLLAAIDGITVVSPAATADMDESGTTVPELAARLGVDTVLQGSVHHFGDTLHVMVNLVDARTGATLWSQNYDQHIQQLFEVQDDIAANVARVLRVQVQDSEQPDSRMATTGNVEAFTQYLRGKALMDSRVTLGPESLHESLRRFEEAVRLDPRFVLAHVGVAAAQYLLSAYDHTLDLDTQLRLAESNARYALQLDPSSAEALGVLGAVLFRRGESLQAAALFNRAMTLGNQDPNFIHWRALLFISMGYFEQLVPELQQAYTVDPLNPLLGCSLGSALTLSGRPQESMDVFAGMTRFSRRDLGMGMSSLYLGDFDTARRMLSGLQLWSGELPPDFADRLVDAFQDPVQYPGVEELFLRAARHGEIEAPLAFEALLILGSPRAFELEIDFDGTEFEYRLPEPVWSNWGMRLRQDPRFKAWIRALGYDQYWRQNGWPDRCSPTSLDDFECI